MNWQEIAVVVIVAGAVYFLARKFFGVGPRRPKKTPTSFVPLQTLKKDKGGKPR